MCRYFLVSVSAARTPIFSANEREFEHGDYSAKLQPTGVFVRQYLVFRDGVKIMTVPW